MDARFQVFVERLEPKHQALLRSPALRPTSLPKLLPERGVYLFSEGARYLYVGRSNDLRERIQVHCRPSSGLNQAAFGYRLAKSQTGIVPGYKKLSPTEDWSTKEPFVSAFRNAKARIRDMSVRVIEERDPFGQMLLEAYVHLTLATPHNDFENH